MIKSKEKILGRKFFKVNIRRSSVYNSKGSAHYFAADVVEHKHGVLALVLFPFVVLLQLWVVLDGRQRGHVQQRFHLLIREMVNPCFASFG